MDQLFVLYRVCFVLHMVGQISILPLVQTSSCTLWDNVRQELLEKQWLVVETIDKLCRAAFNLETHNLLGTVVSNSELNKHMYI